MINEFTDNSVMELGKTIAAMIMMLGVLIPPLLTIVTYDYFGKGFKLKTIISIIQIALGCCISILIIVFFGEFTT